jgi:hypothetical protein
MLSLPLKSPFKLDAYPGTKAETHVNQAPVAPASLLVPKYTRFP